MTNFPDDEKELLPPLENALFSAPHDLTLFSPDPDAALVGVDGRDDCTDVGLLAAIMVCCVPASKLWSPKSVWPWRVFGHVVAIA
jgi:hypothetical protein